MATQRRRTKRLEPLELRAYHEAGHAVVAMLRGFGVSRITVSRRGPIGGACEFRFIVPRRASAGGTKRVVRAAGAVALAGSVAEDRAALERGFVSVDLRSGLPFPLFAPGAEEDRRIALRFAARIHPDRAARYAFLRRMRSSAERQLEDPRVWAAVERLAHRLARARMLTGDRAVRTVVRAIAATPAVEPPRAPPSAGRTGASSPTLPPRASPPRERPSRSSSGDAADAVTRTRAPSARPAPRSRKPKLTS